MSDGTGQYGVEWVVDLNSGTRALETALKGWVGGYFSNLVSQTGVAISHTGRRSATYHGPSKEAWILPTGWTVAMVVDTKGKTMRLLIRILLLHHR